MARYVGPVCRLCRREGEKLFLKGERCYGSSCGFERRSYAPGQHGRARGSKSDFNVQLREKQKTRRIFSILEGQFESYFDKAVKVRGVTGTELLRLLETRLDNVVYRLGFASSRKKARQMVSHGHITVNGRKVTIASYPTSAGDVVQVSEKLKAGTEVPTSVQNAASRVVPKWLSLDSKNFIGTVNALPSREEMPQNVNEQLIVELYSK